MKVANVFFTFNGANITIQCSIDDKMLNICEKFSKKIDKDINSLLFFKYRKSNKF